MKAILSALAAGLVFGLGLIVSGMVNPAKVLNFLDIAGQWDPSLAFVMAGAASTVFIGYRFVLKRPAPLFADRFNLPGATRIDARLIGGAIMFGIGWGLVGLCPGPALTALGTGAVPVVVFAAAMLAGMAGWRWLVRD
ncbi:MAG: gene II and X family protein [Oceanicaulis sp. HLUCCA04]|nr:MAG: gene II and X family protein [Oceanicaulis sp. HLUCCA04]